MSIQEVSPEQLAQLFHHYHQALAPDFHCASTQEHEAWDDIPQQEKGRMIAAARLVLLELDSTLHAQATRKYFAKPGDAEWGC